jgi:cytidyltransferase-like protein
MSKICNSTSRVKTYIEALEEYKNTKFVVGYTSGVFDMCHKGHRHFILAASRRCDFLVVSVASDIQVSSRKGPNRPVFSRNDRAEAIDSLFFLGAVLVTEPLYDSELGRYATNPEECKIISPDIAFFGDDYTLETIPIHRRAYAPKLRDNLR